MISIFKFINTDGLRLFWSIGHCSKKLKLILKNILVSYSNYLGTVIV